MQWQVRQRSSGYEALVPLMAYWEADGDPISDDYLPDEITAHDLLAQWVERYASKASNGLVRIFWFVESRSDGICEYMPFQQHHLQHDEDFLTFYSWPTHPVTGERLNWLSLPVVDKLWRSGRADKGGFIQEATGWKPSILQPWVALESLLQRESHRKTWRDDLATRTHGA
jgi:hypothetical protein